MKYEVPKDAAKDAMAVAIWADGMKAPCTFTTCEKALEREAPKLDGKRGAAETWWSGTSKEGVELQLRKVSRKNVEWA